MLSIRSKRKRMPSRMGVYALLVFSFIISTTTISCTNKQQKPDPVAEEKTKETNMSTEAHQKNKRIIFFGNSLTAGYGLDNEGQAFPSLIQNRIDSLGLPYTAVNAGLSGETTAGGNSRISWVLRQQIDIFVLELGANDVLRGLDLDATEKNLRAIMDKVRKKYPEVKIILAGMMAPPNMGQDYATRFNDIYPRLAKEYNAGLIPFLLQDVATFSHLNLGDGIHPNAEGYKIVAENVWGVLEGYL